MLIVGMDGGTRSHDPCRITPLPKGARSHCHSGVDYGCTSDQELRKEESAFLSVDIRIPSPELPNDSTLLVLKDTFSLVNVFLK